jgi:NAD(P)-dependent dehydrogenase (short-subunit alcohol dehydrogenase family)
MMKEFKDKVAVVTGAASGIGLGLAERCVKEGMKVVLADVEEPALNQAEKALRAQDGNVIAVRTDVSKANDIETLSKKTLDEFGAVHLLFNNAGVEVTGRVWDQTLPDWEWIINVNLWGVIHGIRVFVPIMLQQQTECHIVNTASTAALTSGPGLGSYRMTKHGVTGLSETLYHELNQQNAPIGVSVLFPSFVRTRLQQADRNRPSELQNQPGEVQLSPEEQARIQWFREQNEKGMPPEQFADIVFNGIKKNQFYIISHPESMTSVRQRVEDILQQRNPIPMGE